MEPVLAKWAVYNSAGFIQRIGTLLSNLLFSLLNSTTGLLLMLSVSVGCVVISTRYLWKSPHSMNGQSDLRPPQLYVSWNCLSPSNLEMFQQEWCNLYKLSYQEFLNLWIVSLNRELSLLQNALTFLIHSVEIKPVFHFNTLECHSSSENHAQPSVITLTVHSPLLVLRCYFSRKDDCLSKPTLLSITDFLSKMEIHITHHGTRICNVKMKMLGKPKFSVFVEDPYSNQTELIKSTLEDTLLKSQVDWIPAPSDANTVDPINFSFSKEAENFNASIEMPDEENEPSSVRDSCMTKNWRANSFPLRNAASMEDTGATVDNRMCNQDASQQSLFGPGDCHFEVPLIGGSLEGLKGSRSHWKSCSLHNSESPIPMILPYNATVRQSLVDHQLPKHQSVLVRSASYYGERASRLHSEVESPEDSSPVFPVSPAKIFQDYPGQSSLKSSDLQSPCLKTGAQSTKPDFPSRSMLTEISTVKNDLVQTHMCRKLLVNVINAEGLIFKGASTAYCVVELDEPYQRHTTHCSSSVQLFWDQHLLFDLNSNSKKITIEVFELLKRKKSVSKGRADLVLSALNDISGKTEGCTGFTILVGPRETSDFRLRLPLSDRVPTVLPDINSAALPVSSSTHAELGLTPLEPVVTVEFHFMEKAVDETHMRRPGGLRSPSAVQRALSTRLQSLSAHDSPLLGSPLTSNSLPHSTSFEFTNSSCLAPKIVEVVAKAETVGEISFGSPSPVNSMKYVATEVDCTVDVANTEITEPNPLTTRVSSPVYARRTPVDRVKSTDLPSTSLESFHSHDRSAEDRGSVSDDSASAAAKHSLPSPLSLTQPERISPLGPLSASVQADNSRLDNSGNRSNIIGSSDAGEPFDLTYRDSTFDAPKDCSSVTESTFVSSPRSQSLAGRLRPSRLLSSSSARSGKRSSDDSAVSSATGSLALLGPSRQLAGMVAGLSALPSGSVTSPISAASLAAAVAVAGATGSWKQVKMHDAGSEDLFGKAAVTNKASAIAHKPPTHHIPPAACVAIGKPGTFTALSQPRRSDVSNLSLFRLFRHKKKRFRSVGAEKFYFLEHANVGEFDTISTEGYYRIVRDTETTTHDSTPP